MRDWMCRGRGEVQSLFHLKFISSPLNNFLSSDPCGWPSQWWRVREIFRCFFFLLPISFYICMNLGQVLGCGKAILYFHSYLLWGSLHEFTAGKARRRTCICNCISFCIDSLCMNLQLGMSQDKRKHQTFDLSRKIHDRWGCNLHYFVLERIKYQIFQLLLQYRVRLHSGGDAWWARRMQNWTLWLWQSGKKSLKVAN